MKVFFDELDESFDKIEEFDLEMWFDNKQDKKHYIICGTIERWDSKGSGHYPEIYNSIWEAINNASRDWGICYMKIYEKDYGKLFIDISHHDGFNSLQIREVTKAGEEIINNSLYYEDDIVAKLLKSPKYTKNTKFSKNYW